MTQPPELPLTFRDELAPHLFKALLGGWSCAVVGFAGCGLSNLLRFVAEPRVAQHHLQAEAANTLVVLVDADRLLDPAQLFPVLARQVLLSARAQGWPRAEQAVLRHLAQQPPAQHPAAPAADAAQVAEPAAPLAGMLAHLCDALQRRVFFVCDEFDAALRGLPAASLRELRALRDAHKYQLAFLAGLRREPGWLAAERMAGDPGLGAAKFAELFEQHTFPLRPYTRADAGLAIARKSLGWAEAPTLEQQDNLYRLTGGHAKLLIASLIYLESRRHLPWANVERGLLGDPRLAGICRAIWDDLEPADRAALWLLANDRRADLAEADLNRLLLLGLAVGGPAFVFSSLLEAFVATMPQPQPVPGQERPVSHLRDPQAAVYW